MSRELAAEQLAQANRALARFRYHDVLNAAQVALAELEEVQAELELRAQAHELAGQAALNCGEYLEAEEHIRNAANLLHELGAERRLLDCRCILAECASRQGDLRGARHQAEEALAIARSQTWSELEARAHHCLGNICWQEGKLGDAEAYLRSAIEMFDQCSAKHHASSARSSLGIVYALQGREEEASEFLYSAMRQFQAVGDSARMVRCLNNMAGLAFQRGDSSRAREYLLQCVELEQDMQDRGDLVQSWYNLGVIEMHEQRLPLARKHFHRAKHLAQDVGDRSTEGAALIQLGIASLLNSDTDEAMNYLLLSESLLAGSPSTTAQVVQLYKPVFYLAHGHYEIARELWSSKPSHVETSLVRAMCDLLHFLQSDKSNCSARQEVQFIRLAELWIAELTQLL